MEFKSDWITTKEFFKLEKHNSLHKMFIEDDVVIEHPYKNVHCWFCCSLLAESESEYKINISADDYYKLYVNGSFVAQGPSPSYPYNYSFNSINITEFLSKGNNVIAVHVYYQGLKNRVWHSGDNRMGMICDIVCDGKIQESIIDWKYKYAYEYSGEATGYETQFLENIDFRKKDPEIKLFKGDGWNDAVKDEQHGHTFKDKPDDILQVYTIKPDVIKKLDNGYFLDFGQEIVGTVCFKAKGKQGEKIEILCGEELEKPLSVKFNMRCKCCYHEVCTLSGDIDDFDFYDYKGFRYVNIICDSKTVYEDSICAIVRHRKFDDKKGIIATTDKNIKDIWNLCRNTAKFATQEGFLDCPTREKGQYLGDFTVSGLAHLYITGDREMYKKTLMDFAMSAKICPGIMAVAPGELMQEIADFSLQYPLQIYNYYKFTKDIETVRELFPIVQGLIEHFQQFSREDGLLVGVTDKWNIVDWPVNLRDGYDNELNSPIEKDAIHNVINAFWVGTVITYEKLAGFIGVDVKKLSDKLMESFNRTFYDKKAGLYSDLPVNDYKDTPPHYSLHSNVLPVFYKFNEKESSKTILSMIKKKGLNCGVQFSYFVLKACANLGDYDMEYKLIINKGKHSWNNMLKEGATTVFEAWGKDEKWNTSLCHPWASAPVIAIYEDLCGNFKDIKIT